jgi:hypothetical protein
MQAGLPDLNKGHLVTFFIEPGREPINAPGGRPARVRHAPIADALWHSSETTLCANRRHRMLQLPSEAALLLKSGRKRQNAISRV